MSDILFWIMRAAQATAQDSGFRATHSLHITENPRRGRVEELEDGCHVWQRHLASSRTPEMLPMPQNSKCGRDAIRRYQHTSEESRQNRTTSHDTPRHPLAPTWLALWWRRYYYLATRATAGRDNSFNGVFMRSRPGSCGGGTQTRTRPMDPPKLILALQRAMGDLGCARLLTHRRSKTVASEAVLESLVGIVNRNHLY